MKEGMTAMERLEQKPEDEFFRTHSDGEIWRRFCGFLDLSIEEFMEIQRSLLMEQIELVAGSTLGRKIMGDKKPASVEEFRRVIPLTTYTDYELYLKEKSGDVLAEKPVFWCHSSGRGGDFKWIPYTERFYEKAIENMISVLILACAGGRGEVNLKYRDRAVYNVAAKPYASGFFSEGIDKKFTLRLLPPLEIADEMEFEERIKESFRLALYKGVDIVGSISSILVKIGEGFAERQGGMKLSSSMMRPGVLWRLGRALLRSKLERRQMLPKDLWKLKAVIGMGGDAFIYRNQVNYYWGKIPWEFYGGTEIGVLAMHSWTRKSMTFTPFSCFIEFIPEEEWMKSREDEEYRPSTVLLDEVEEGGCYEIVITVFYGMPFLRYRPGDLIRIVSLRDEETGINLPQITFKSRADGLIDLGGLTRLDEKTVWQAIANTGIKYEDWSARKEYAGDTTCLRIYLELKESREADELEEMIDRRLREIDVNYREVGDILGLQPVRVTLLSPGTFQRYYEEKRSEGADLAHLKPCHMNAQDTVIQELLQFDLEE